MFCFLKFYFLSVCLLDWGYTGTNCLQYPSIGMVYNWLDTKMKNLLPNLPHNIAQKEVFYSVKNLHLLKILLLLLSLFRYTYMGYLGL